jgi:hypothetical protein
MVDTASATPPLTGVIREIKNLSRETPASLVPIIITTSVGHGQFEVIMRPLNLSLQA